MSERAAALLLAGALLSAACGPIPSGTLAGEPAPPPASWEEVVEETGFCEVESRPSDPHSIQLYCFVHEGGLYVQSHRWALAPWWPTTSWAAIWLEHPDVTVRIESSLYQLRAVQVTESEGRSVVMASIGYDPPPEGIVLFRFEPRP